ncbi:hypothetical protein, partial [Streptomyces sp. RP5T]|uniref:hypothetical protein n=1 Tax=Streptomyces sp. RP5T TaxID=2490848 RepID=UPI001C8C24FB
VRAERGGIAAGGDICGNAIGARSQVSGPRTPARGTAARHGTGDVHARPGATAAGGDVTDNAFGDGSRR